MAEINPAALTKGFWKVISDTTLVANQTFIDFLNLDLNTDGEYILAASIFNNNVANTDYNLFMNGDFADIDYIRHLFVDPVSISGNSGVFITLAQNESISIEFHILRNPIGKIYQTFIATNLNAALNVTSIEIGSVVLFPPAANLTSLRLNASNANALPAGSRFTLSKVIS